MPKIKCTAFKAHRCMKNELANYALLCCHSCTDYDTCRDRCENKPRSCNKSEIVPDDCYLYIPKVSTNRRIGQSKGGVLQLDADTGEVLGEYKTVKDAAYQMIKEYPSRKLANVKQGIGQCARGVVKTACGYDWRYVNK